MRRLRPVGIDAPIDIRIDHKEILACKPVINVKTASFPLLHGQGVGLGQIPLPLHRRFAVGQRQVDHIGRTQFEEQAIYIGQLVALRIDHPVVGIANGGLGW